MLRKLWKDEAGTVALEYLLVATIASLALVAGLSTVGHALNQELTELACAIVNIDQSYSYSGYSTCVGQVAGSAVTDADGAVISANVDATASDCSIDFCTGAGVGE